MGAFSKDQVEAMRRAGAITDETLAWTSGLAGWKPIKEVLDSQMPPPVPLATAPAVPPMTGQVQAPPIDAVPPVIVAPPVASGTIATEFTRREIQMLTRDTKLGIWCILAWVLAVPALVGGISGNGLSAIIAFGLMVAALRGVARKATATVLAKRNWQFSRYGRDVYIPAVWGTLWRAAILVFLVALFFAVGSNDPRKAVESSMTVTFLWIMTFPFMLDRPLWFRSRIHNLTANSSMPPLSAQVGATDMHSPSTSSTRPVSLFFRPLTVIIIVVLCVGIGGMCWLLVSKHAQLDRIGKMATENQRFNQELAGLVEAGAALNQIKQLQDTQFTNISSEAASVFKGDAKMVYEAMKPITDQAVVHRQRCQEGMQKLLDAVFVNAAGLTNGSAVVARKKMAEGLLKDTTEAYSFFAGHVEMLDSGLKAVGIAKSSRDDILAKNRSKQPLLLALARTNSQIAKQALSILTFLNDNYGHWSMEGDLCAFETQDKTDEYNKLVEGLESCLSEADKLEQSFFDKK